ncbi:MAG TPA: S41 family peptidase [Pyrinomonadaceae bacterium]|jgi:C-terminal processing protease CtpA/Prc|nr:S41 family peptidase [Pyrinomonadaceae bacterium]
MNFPNRLKHSKPGLHFLRLIFSLLLFVNLQPTQAQTPATATLNTNEAKSNREMGLAMLDEMKKVLEEYYYDAKYHGIDLKARFEAAKNRIKTLNYNWQVYRVLAQVLLDFNDSHTRLILPPRTDFFQYGFTVQIIGDKCFIVSVKKGSDADKKGLRVGDQVLNIGKFAPTRENLWKIIYVLYRLDPANTVDLKIKNLEGTDTSMTVTAKTMTIKEYKEERKKHKDDEAEKPFKCQEISTEVIACKLYTFVVEKSQIDKMMKQVGQHSKLILDLRGNSGGYVSVEAYLTGYLFDHDVKVSDLVTRKKTEIEMAKSRNDKSFKGELVVLVDSKSASAAECVARVVQIERRGKIIGDVTMGAVMTSVTAPLFGHISSMSDYATTYTGMSVTIADVIMKDGSRIEGVGVIPDEAIGPTGLGLAHKTDPVLAYAAIKLGAKLTPEQAGQFYFIRDKQEDEDDAETESDQ